VNLYSLAHGLFLSTGVLILILVVACAVSGGSLGVLYSRLPSQIGWHTVERTADCDVLSTALLIAYVCFGVAVTLGVRRRLLVRWHESR